MVIKKTFFNMKMKNTFIWATLFVAQIMGSMVYGKVLDVLSPDKNIKVSIELKDKIYYSIFRRQI